MMTRIVQLMVLLTLLATSALVDASAGNYRLREGDVIRIALSGEDTLDKTFAVDPQGGIVLPDLRSHGDQRRQKAR